MFRKLFAACMLMISSASAAFAIGQTYSFGNSEWEIVDTNQVGGHFETKVHLSYGVIKDGKPLTWKYEIKINNDSLVSSPEWATIFQTAIGIVAVIKFRVNTMGCVAAHSAIYIQFQDAKGETEPRVFHSHTHNCGPSFQVNYGDGGSYITFDDMLPRPIVEGVEPQVFSAMFFLDKPRIGTMTGNDFRKWRAALAAKAKSSTRQPAAKQ